MNIDARFDGVDRKIDLRFDALDNKIDEFRDALDKKIDQFRDVLDKKIDALDSKFDQRFNAVDKRFNAVDKRFDAVDQRFDALNARIDQRFVWMFGIFITAWGTTIASIFLHRYHFFRGPATRKRALKIRFADAMIGQALHRWRGSRSSGELAVGGPLRP